MISPNKINTLSEATTAERDANYTGITQSSMFFNTDTQAIEITKDGGSSWENIIDSSVLNVTSDKIETTAEEIAFTPTVVGAGYSPCISIQVVADGPISAGDVVTASTATDFRVIAVSSAAPDSTAVVGFALTSSINPGETITICGAILVKLTTDSISTVLAGDFIEKSDTDNGKVRNASSSVGTFGVAAQSAGTSSPIKVWIRSSESF